ncbi:hypothetical protein Tco_0044572 [Tanacetum coccineum]|uniref:Uncharacterized protein n=1 Tax=Tanacetum coccineum TaxID=301880 RepID=A0ABQ4YPK8_9ASTR
MHLLISTRLWNLEFEIERILRAVVSQDILSIVQKHSVVDTSNLQTELDRTKEKLKTCIIKKEKEYAVLWNNWYKKYEECKYDNISYDKAYNDMQQKIEQFQAQLGNLKEKEHLKTTYKNLFDSIKVTRAQNKLITDSLQEKLHDTNENATLKAQLFDKVSEQKDTTKGMSGNTKFAKQTIMGKQQSSLGSKLYSVTPFPKTLSKPVTSHTIPKTQKSKVVKSTNVIAPGMFRTNPLKNSKKDVNSNTKGLPSTGVESAAKTRRPQPRSNPKNDRR